MKGICEYKVIRDGKEIKHGTKHNVIFDIPKIYAESYFAIRDACQSAALIKMNLSNGTNYTEGVFQNNPSFYLSMFKGVRVYGENISTTNPYDVKVPILMAGPTKNASAPATQAQSSISVNESEIITSATWNLSADKTINSLALCFDVAAENLANVLKVHESNTGYLEQASSNYGCSFHAKVISPTKSITKWAYAKSYSYIRGCNMSADLTEMSKKSTPIVSLKSGMLNSGMHSGFYINPAKTLAYFIDSMGYSGSCVINVYTIADWSLLKTYTVSQSRSYFILFTDDVDFLYENEVGTANINIYSLSRSDNTKTLLTTITAPIATSSSASGGAAINNTFVAYTKGFVIGIPVYNEVTEEYDTPVYYSYMNSSIYTPSIANIQLTNEDAIVPIVVHPYSSTLTDGATKDAIMKGAGASLWMNTTALNFDEPIELLSGDTFVITYKIQLS